MGWNAVDKVWSVEVKPQQDDDAEMEYPREQGRAVVDGGGAAAEDTRCSQLCLAAVCFPAGAFFLIN